MENKDCPSFCRLVEIMAKLRAPDGCPWDRKQTEKSLVKYLLEETYEVVDAIEEGNPEKLKEELGDLLLQVVFLAQIAREKGQFTIEDVAKFIGDKLISRHPHVFGSEKFETAQEVLEHWDSFKKKEKKKLLDGVPVSSPALLEAYLIGERAARVGFDWEKAEDVFEKIEEEINELREAVKKGEGTEEEMGDVLFSLANLARKLNVNPELALKKTNRKFRERFGKIEKEAEKRGKELRELSLKDMDEIWEAAKKK